MNPRVKLLLKIVLLGVVAILLVVALVAATPIVQPAVKRWLEGHKAEEAATGVESRPSHELVRDAQNRPVQPYTIRLAPETVRGLKISRGEVKQAGKLSLPAQVGTLAYDTDHLYTVRPRFQGEVIEMGQYSGNGANLESFQKFLKERPLGPGDTVKQGDVLAVLWSKELGDRKVTLVSALLDLWVDEETLRQLDPIYQSGSLPDATYRASKSKVEKDLAAVYAAESSLRISRLTAEEVEQVRKEAKVIQKRLQGKPETPEQRKQRQDEEVKKWARVDVAVPRLNRDENKKLLIVEKNTNLNDMVDPSRDMPLFRLADLGSLMIYVNFHEEYLPLLQPLLRAENPSEIRWQIRIEAEPDLPVLDLPILRVAPSLDPNQHTAVVIGRIPNPVKADSREKFLVVGQFVTATVEVPSGPGVVEIPTNALNEVGGESLVFVQRDPSRAEYTLRRVAVVRRSKDVTLVRSKLTSEEEEALKAEVKQGHRPIETLQVHDLVITHGVTEMTDALEQLIGKARAEK